MFILAPFSVTFLLALSSKPADRHPLTVGQAIAETARRAAGNGYILSVFRRKNRAEETWSVRIQESVSPAPRIGRTSITGLEGALAGQLLRGIASRPGMYYRPATIQADTGRLRKMGLDMVREPEITVLPNGRVEIRWEATLRPPVKSIKLNQPGDPDTYVLSLRADDAIAHIHIGGLLMRHGISWNEVGGEPACDVRVPAGREVVARRILVSDAMQRGYADALITDTKLTHFRRVPWESARLVLGGRFAFGQLDRLPRPVVIALGDSDVAGKLGEGSMISSERALEVKWRQRHYLDYFGTERKGYDVDISIPAVPSLHLSKAHFRFQVLHSGELKRLL